MATLEAGSGLKLNSLLFSYVTVCLCKLQATVTQRAQSAGCEWAKFEESTRHMEHFHMQFITFHSPVNAQQK